MNELSAQFRKSSLIPLFYGSITAVAAILVQIVARLDDVSRSEDVHLTFLEDAHVEDVLFGDLLGYLAISYLVYFFVVFLLLGFWGSKRVFREASVLEKEEKIFALIQQYLEFE
jgi:predicted permease